MPEPSGAPSRAKTRVEGGGDVEVEGVAELVLLGGAVGFDAGGFVAGVMAAERGAAERAEQIAEGLVAEEVHALVGDFEAGVGRCLRRSDLRLGGLFGVEEVLVLHALDDFVDELFDLAVVEVVELLLCVFVEELAGFERLADGFAEVFHGLLARSGRASRGPGSRSRGGSRRGPA